MRITSVKVNPLEGSKGSKLRAVVSVKFDDCFVINDIKIIQTEKGYILAMPSKKLKNGDYADVCHPLNKDMREILESAVMEECRNTLDGQAA